MGRNCHSKYMKTTAEMCIKSLVTFQFQQSPDLLSYCSIWQFQLRVPCHYFLLLCEGSLVVRWRISQLQLHMLQLGLNELKESKPPKFCLDTLNQNLKRSGPFWFCRKYLSLLQSSSVRLAQSWDFTKFVLAVFSIFLLLFRGKEKMDWFLSWYLQVRKSLDAMAFLLNKFPERRELFFNRRVSEKFLCICCFSWATYCSWHSLSRRIGLDILRGPFWPQWFCNSVIQLWFPILTGQGDIWCSIFWKRIVGLSHDSSCKKSKALV